MNVQDIVDKLIQYKKSYYNGESEVSDKEFDELEESLRHIDPNNGYFALVGSPTIVGDKRKHKIAMGSQAKVKIEDHGVAKVCERFISQGSTIVSYKMDGISCAIEYNNGSLQCATSRGDGVVGDVLINAHEFGNIPETIEELYEFTARCELVIHYDDFELINAQLEDDDKFSNPRNAVAGIARKADSPFRKYITAYYYDVVGNFVADWKETTFGLLVDAFGQDAVVPYFVNMSNTEFRTLAEDLDKTRKQLPYMIDGLVIEFNSLEKMEKLGVANGNKPKGSVALKFSPITETSMIRGVVWQVNSTGNLTPVVEFSPTLIDGSVVRRASIHNYDIFKEWDFEEGDIVEVQKNNDIIPQVKRVVSRVGVGDQFTTPTHCPVCDSELQLIKAAKTTNLVCTNPLCDAKRMGSIKKWCDKAGMTSKGVGDAFFKSYVDYCERQEDGFNISTVYCLSIDDIMEMSDRYKTKSATKIYNAIQSSKTMKLMDVFGGLNIHGCGSRTFKKIIDASGATTIVDVYDYCMMNDLSTIDGVGDVTAKAIVNGLPSCHNDMVCMMLEIEIIQEQQAIGNLGSFLFTGKFSTKRKDLEYMVVDAGGNISSSVNKSLDYLVQSDPTSTSSKSKKAEKLGIPIIGEDEFLKLLHPQE